MADTRKVNLDLLSRFRGTDLVVSSGRAHWGIWEAPEISLEDARTEMVRSSDVGRWDLMALRLYGSTALWWVIPAVNGVLDVFDLQSPGDVLTVPSKTSVLSALEKL